MLGFDHDTNVVNKDDTANLRAFLYNREDQPHEDVDLAGVTFTIQRPDGTKVTVEGEVDEDGGGTATYDTTDAVGQYITVATFETVEGERRSVRDDFEVIDPFEATTPTELELLADAVWRKFEDLFDGEDEGPWLRDQTMNYFNRHKMSEFTSDAIFELNNMNPPTHATLDLFYYEGAATADGPLLVQGTYLAVLRHLIRSYTEQPAPTGAPVGYLDRRDYATRWMQVYQLELAIWQRWSALWKRQFLGLGKGKLLVGSKAGRLIQAPMRTRYVGRGYF